MAVLYGSTRGKRRKNYSFYGYFKGTGRGRRIISSADSIPALDNVPLKELLGKSYQEIAYQVMSRLLTDFTEEELRNCINKAYDSEVPMRLKSLRW